MTGTALLHGLGIRSQLCGVVWCGVVLSGVVWCCTMLLNGYYDYDLLWCISEHTRICPILLFYFIFKAYFYLFCLRSSRLITRPSSNPHPSLLLLTSFSTISTPLIPPPHPTASLLPSSQLPSPLLPGTPDSTGGSKVSSLAASSSKGDSGSKSLRNS